MAEEAIEAQEFKELAANVLDGFADLKSALNKMVTKYNAHTHVVSGTYTIPAPHTIVYMKPFAEAKYKSFRIEVFTYDGKLGDIKVHDTNGSRTDRIGKRKMRKAKKILIPATTMWFKSGFKDTMPLEEFIRTTLKK